MDEIRMAIIIKHRTINMVSKIGNCLIRHFNNCSSPTSDQYKQAAQAIVIQYSALDDPAVPAKPWVITIIMQNMLCFY